jgi:mono/diheme cytochrome c family protein
MKTEIDYMLRFPIADWINRLLIGSTLSILVAACADDGSSTAIDFPYETPDTGTSSNIDPNIPETPAPTTDAGGGADGAIKTNDGGAVQLDDGAMPIAPAVPASAIKIEAFPQPAGDPKKGYDYLVNGDYDRIGPALEAYIKASSKVKASDQVPGREGANVKLSYQFNAAKADDGQMVAAVNCLGCHAFHLQGKLIVGLGRANHMVNTFTSGMTIDVFSTILNDVSGLNNGLDFLLRLFPGPLKGGHHMDVFADLISHRDPKTLKWSSNASFDSKSGLRGWADFPPWWATKKKNALYYNGSGRGVKGHHMQIMSWFSVKDVAEATIIEEKFNDVNAWIDTLEAPKFPGKIDSALADQGKKIYLANCAQCHGTYGATDAEDTYPNLLIPASEVGTDPDLAANHWMTKGMDWYSKSWYARNKDSWFEKVVGYMPPPLDGIWATAPYFHNGSVPTLDAVIDPKKRLDSWTTNNTEDDYDLEKVGWKDKFGDWQLINLELIRLEPTLGTYNTKAAGNSNKGHTYGAHLDAAGQKALLEYLKTL